MDEIKREYFSIGEVSELVKLSPSVIRHIEGIFSIRVGRNSHGNRRYDTKSLERLEFIRHLLQDEGFTYRGALKKYREKYK